MGTFFIDDVSASILPASAFRMIESDFNGDGAVDGLDLDVWKQGFGANFDGADFLAWQRNLGVGGSSVASSTPVPEPASVMVFAGVALFIAFAPRLGGERRRERPRPARNSANEGPSSPGAQNAVKLAQRPAGYHKRGPLDRAARRSRRPSVDRP